MRKSLKGFLEHNNWLYQKYVVERLHVWEIAKLVNCSSITIKRYVSKFGLKRKKIRTQKHSEKISNSNKGKTISLKTRRKISQAKKGWKPSDETRQKISIAHKNKKLTKEHKRNISNNSPRLRGKNHWNWKGGITTLQQQIRHLIEYKQWRTKCYQRDNYTCQICGEYGKKLNVDHFIPFSMILEQENIQTIENAIRCRKLWDINNGRTLCVSCHRQTKTYGGRLRK